MAGTDGPLLQIPDGFDIFTARFTRDGDDLVIAGEDSPPLTIVDYFAGGMPPALVAPNGAMLTGNVVQHLAGPLAPAQYAQADAPQGATPIGQIEVLTGSATATRVTGEVVELGQDAPVFQGDVIETGSDSTLGIRLEDGTLASLSAQSRLVLNEFVYQAGGSDNWMLVDLVEGAFAFLTGAIAPSGGMEITTPVAVMAIRGTMPIAIVAQNGASQFFAGSDETYELLHVTTNELLAVISSGVGYSLSSPNASLETIDIDPETLEEINDLLDVLNDAAASLGFLGIMTDSGFHAHSGFGSIGSVVLMDFLLLLQGSLAAEAVIEVEDGQQFLMAEPDLIANPDEAATVEMAPVAVDVRANDSHPDGGELTVIFADVPNGQGTVTITDDQLVIYDPGTAFQHLALDETAEVVVTYAVSHASGAITSSTVTVTVSGLNQAPVVIPVAQANANEPTDSQPLETTIGLSFTDVDLNNVGHDVTVTAVTVSGNDSGLTLDEAGLIALLTSGPVSKEAGQDNGSVEFQFSVDSMTLDYLAMGETLTLTYTVEIDDQDGGVTSQDIKVRITGTNDAPVIDVDLSDEEGTVVEDGLDADQNPVGGSGASGQIDADDVDNGGKVFSVDTTTGTYGEFAIDETGAWTYTLNENVADPLALGETDTDQFTVTVTDNFGATDQVVVTLTITGANDVPVVSDVSLGAVEDGPGFTASFSGDDIDSDDDPDTLVYTVATQPAEGSVINNNDGTFTFDPGGDFQDLAAGESRDVTFTYTATDRHGTASEPATVTVTVTGTADEPEIGGVATGAVTEDSGVVDGELTTGGKLTIADPDAGQSTFAPQAGTTGSNGFGGFTLLADGTWSYTADNTQDAIQQLGAGDTLTDSFTAVSSDGSASRTVTVTITGTNDVPVIGGDSTGGVTEDAVPTLTTGGTLTIADVDTGESSFAPQSGTAGSNGFGTFTLLADGNWTYSADTAQAAIQQLGQGDTLTDSFTAVSSDGSASQTVTVTITGTNDVPVIGGDVTGAVTEDAAPATITTGGTLTIADVDAGESSFAPQSSTAGSNGFGTFTLEADGIWSYSADTTQAAIQQLAEGETLTDSFTAVSSDGTASQVVTVTIHGSNDKPRITVEEGDSDEFVTAPNLATAAVFLLMMDTGDPVYTPGEIGNLKLEVSYDGGITHETVSVEFVMGPSHVETIDNLIAAINAGDFGLQAGPAQNPFNFELTVEPDGLFAPELDVNGAEFTNTIRDESFVVGVEVLEEGTDGSGIAATGTLTVSDVDVSDEVVAKVTDVEVTGDAPISKEDLLAMISVDGDPVIDSGQTVGKITWSFDSGLETFDFLAPDATLVLTYTIQATDTNGALTEHEVTITITGPGSVETELASLSSTTLLASEDTLQDDMDGQVFVLTDLSIDDVIVDYQEGDVIDLTRLGFELATGQLNAEAAAEFVSYEAPTGELKVDVDGFADGQDFELAAELAAPTHSVLVRLTDGTTTADVEIA